MEMRRLRSREEWEDYKKKIRDFCAKANERLDDMSPKEREIAEALLAAKTDEELHAIVRKLCAEAEKEAMEALNKPESSNPSA